MMNIYASILVLTIGLIDFSYASASQDENNTTSDVFHKYTDLPLDVQVYALQFMDEPDKFFLLNKGLYENIKLVYCWAEPIDRLEKIVKGSIDDKKILVSNSSLIKELRGTMEMSVIKRLLGCVEKTKDSQIKAIIAGVVRQHIQSNVPHYRDKFIELGRKNRFIEQQAIKFVRSLSTQPMPVIHSKSIPVLYLSYMDKAMLEEIETFNGETIRKWVFPSEAKLPPLLTISHSGSEDKVLETSGDKTS